MGNGQFPYLVERMTWDDVPAVMEIERESFPLPWSSYTYRHELTENKHSHYIVVRSRQPDADRRVWWKRMLRLGILPIVGYGGFWLITDETHISTIAVAPRHRRKGIGELLLAHMIAQAIEMNASLVTLEVRVSNQAAQNLYLKYGFAVTGKRLRYYRDNEEDAHIMTAENVNTPAYQAKFADLQQALWLRLRAESRQPAGQKAVPQL